MDRINEAYMGDLGDVFMRKTQERIHWICSQVPGKRILDVGCSQGTVPLLLGEKGLDIIGLDINDDAIAYAERLLDSKPDGVKDKVHFICKDFLDYEDKEPFDCIIMGEVLEHLANPKTFVRKAYSHLGENGRIVVTVPFGINDDPDHKQTFYYIQMYEMLFPFFTIDSVKFFGKWLGIVGTRRESPVAAAVTVPVLEGLIEEESFYKIERALLTQREELNESNRGKAEQISGLKVQVADYRGQIEENERKIGLLNTSVGDLGAQIETLSDSLAGCQEKLSESEAMREAASEEIARLGGELQTALALSEKRKGEITAYEKRVVEKDGALREMRRERDRAQNQYTSLANSKLGKLTRKYWKFKDAVLRQFRKGDPNAKTIRNFVKKIPGLRPLVLRLRGRKEKPEKKETHEAVQRVEPKAVRLTEPRELKEITIAAILDTFTATCLAPECTLVQFRPDNYKEMFEQYHPDMLLVESAWNGNDGAWQYRVGTYSGVSRAELFEVLDYCRQQGIPTVFWNKEDPPHFEQFIEAASRFDYIFTTDENCIPKYVERCGHDRVYALPFAAQPQRHNPVLSERREKNTCFAGTYYRNRFPKRREEMDSILDAAAPFGLEIYDRMYGTTGPGAENYLFPEKFQSMIRGRLNYDEMIRAYKQYRVFLNVNSVENSRTMFSRRVFELLACGTAVVSTPSDGIRYYFDGIVKEAATVPEGQHALERLLEDEAYRRCVAAAGVRTVMGEHTYRHRLTEVCEKAGMKLRKAEGQKMAVWVRAEDRQGLASALASAARQTLRPVRLLGDQALAEYAEVLKDCPFEVTLLDKTAGALAEALAEDEALAVFDGKNYYAEHYLEDAVLALSYAGEDCTGMCAVFEAENGEVHISGDLSRECFVTEGLEPGTLAVKKSFLEKPGAPALLWENAGAVRGFARYGFEFLKGQSGESELCDRVKLEKLLTGPEGEQGGNA